MHWVQDVVVLSSMTADGTLRTAVFLSSAHRVPVVAAHPNVVAGSLTQFSFPDNVPFAWRVHICARIAELQEALCAGVVAREITSRNCRVQALQDRWSRLRSDLDLLLRERGRDMGR